MEIRGEIARRPPRPIHHDCCQIQMFFAGMAYETRERSLNFPINIQHLANTVELNVTTILQLVNSRRRHQVCVWWKISGKKRRHSQMCVQLSCLGKGQHFYVRLVSAASGQNMDVNSSEHWILRECSFFCYTLVL